MVSIVDDREIVEDRFDDLSFDDAPLSDHESNFDEAELRDCDSDQLPQPIDQIYPQTNWTRPVLSTIPEESKIEDIPTSELTNRSSISQHTSKSSISDFDECASIIAYSIKSSDFITDQKASEIIQREQESFFRGHGRFIQDDPRFNMSKFEKENSWEPSVLDNLSFEDTAEFSRDISVQKNTATKKVTNTNKKRCDSVEKEPAVNHVRMTPKRLLQSSQVANESPNPSELSTNVVQTSTPVSQNAKVASRTRCSELVEKFHGVSMIMPEGDPTIRDLSSLDEQSAAETTTATTISIGTIRGVLKTMPVSSSPRALMKVLDDYKRNRVKAKKIENNLLPHPANRTSQRSCDHPSTKQCSSDESMNQIMKANKSHHLNCEAISKTSETVQDTRRANTRERGEVPRTSEEHLRKPVRDTDRNQEEFLRQERVHKQYDLAGHHQSKPGLEEANRPHSSAGLTTSTSSVANDRCSSKMSSVNTQRSVLYIPQHEVAFGFVAIGDTAVSNVDVTNRTDGSLRIRAKLSHSGPPFTLLDSQILLLDPHRTVPLRIEFSPTQNARFCTNLLIAVEGGGGPQVNYRMPVRGLGGTAIVTVKARDDLRISRNGTYILQSCHETTFSFALTNSGNRRAFSRIIVLCTTESGVLEPIPVEIRPAPGIVIDRGESKQVSIRLQCPLPNSDWKSSQNSLVSTASAIQQRAASKLQVLVYWGEERTRLRLRCFEKLKGISHLCDGIHFTDAFVGEDLTFCPPEDHPISKEDMRLFDQTLRMCTIYVCSTRIRPRPSLISNTSSFDRSLQPEDTFREKSTYKVAVPDQTLR